MNGPILDPALHAPARLQIAAMLAHVQNAEFAKLRDVTGVSDSVLSKHLSALSEAGYVKVSKAALGGRQRTWASFTRSGRKAFADHMAALQALVASAEQAAQQPQADAGTAGGDETGAISESGNGQSGEDIPAGVVAR